MSILNFFKKEKKNAKNNIQKMDKKQLAKVIGGTDTKTSTSTNQGATLLGAALPGGSVLS